MNLRPMLRTISGAEHDVLTRARRRYCYTQRAGVCRSLKRKYNRRVRQKGRAELRAVRGSSGPVPEF